MNEVTQNAATAAGEMSLATAELAQMAQELQKMTAQFKIGSRNGEQKAAALSNQMDRVRASTDSPI